MAHGEQGFRGLQEQPGRNWDGMNSAWYVPLGHATGCVLNKSVPSVERAVRGNAHRSRPIHSQQARALWWTARPWSVDFRRLPQRAWPTWAGRLSSGHALEPSALEISMDGSHSNSHGESIPSAFTHIGDSRWNSSRLLGLIRSERDGQSWPEASRHVDFRGRRHADGKQLSLTRPRPAHWQH